jgi:hypothetical protein
VCGLSVGETRSVTAWRLRRISCILLTALKIELVFIGRSSDRGELVGFLLAIPEMKVKEFLVESHFGWLSPPQ